VVHDHQTINARFMEKMGAAVVITEDNLSGKKLSLEIEALLKNGERLSKMSEAGRKNGITDAAGAIYRIVQELTA
jgi:UDP-N-acetylglucosamine--N-acetylmuramyl-(pentapeptide) pyrophosphoryl-undecaprenol N-acetylglucosamine transferase